MIDQRATALPLRDQLSSVIVIGTRASKLALAQTSLVHTALVQAHPGLQVTIEHITTKGDVVQDRPLSAIGDKGLFVAEIEQALRAGRIDLAVHSAKDLPSVLPDDMLLAAFPRRADVRDALIARAGHRLVELPHGAKVGTTSLRRACQLRALRPDLQVESLRGNVDTRLRKLDEGQYDAIVLAAAGLHRLDLGARITEYLDPSVMLPAGAQGALGLEVRADDHASAALVAPLDDPATRTAVLAERALLAHIGGGCQTPIGAYARLGGDTLTLVGMIGTSDGHMVRRERSGPASDPIALGVALADELLANGGQTLLEASR
jgi:hydroxymethylbilane synthase